MSPTDCVFCKIIKGEIPSATVYEDTDVKVILDIEPASKGHAVIIPKEHAANIYELSEEMAGKIFVVAKKVATAMSKAFSPQGMNILQNNGEIAGQSVFHFHIHVIPRYTGDHVQLGKKTEENGTEKLDLKVLAEQISTYL